MREYSSLFGWQPCCHFQALSSMIDKVSGLKLASSKHTDKNKPCPLHEGVWKSGRTALIILNVGNIWEYAPDALFPRNKFLIPPGIEGFLGRQVRRPVVTIRTICLSVHKVYLCVPMSIRSVNCNHLVFTMKTALSVR